MFGGERLRGRSHPSLQGESGRMRSRPSRELLNVLRRTVDQFEKNTDLAPDDPVLVELKHVLLQRIAELQMLESSPVLADVNLTEKPTTIDQPPADS